MLLTVVDKNTRQWQSILRCQGRVFSSYLSCYESCEDEISCVKCNKSMLGFSYKNIRWQYEICLFYKNSEKKKQITLILLSTALIYRFCQRSDYKVSYMVNIMQRVIVG